ncbi:uncharacterized protein NPIL_681291 [Nephila pilipes]|uniref:Uncharacterized protein n=1 Tax=Nephila pilipes TaxID=299642 RepID=A0A8X6MVP7_NEPPI|nr:uncharacterized protein NPIL_681291 [Nephila pilipes]
MSVESLRVKQKSLRSSFTMCCTSIEEALKKDTTLTDLYALQRQIMDKFTRLDTVQEHILELLLSDDLVSSEYEEDFTKTEKYRDEMNHLSAELENTDPTSEGLDSGRTLDRLMTFLRKEVESEEMILLARTGLGSPQRQKSKATIEEPFLATSAALVNIKGGRSGKQKFCLFCSQCNHWSSDCLIDDSFSCQIKVLSENKICGYLPKVNDLQVLSEIKEKGIIVPDLCNSVNEIDMLLGADVISVILSGRTIKLKSGLIAIGTTLGFTLMGKPSQIVNDNIEISVPTTRERQLKLDVVPLDADAPKIPSANVDVSESTMIPVDAPPNRPKL